MLAGCKHFSATSNGETLTLTVGAMSFPPVGDESSAYGVTFSVKGINAGADFLLFKVDSLRAWSSMATSDSPIRANSKHS